MSLPVNPKHPKVGDRFKIEHECTRAFEKIVIPVTVVEEVTETQVRVDTEFQKGILVKILDLKIV